MVEETTRILSIQSHVVSGYVGNKSAVFPLQLHGFEVDFINSVQFSNRVGYRKVTGQILSEKELDELLQGLSGNDIDNYAYLLTGYIGSISFLTQITSVVKQLRKKNPNLVYVCDPVMGDNGRLYVNEGLVPIYKDRIIPLATIITPNLFEAELLTDLKIKNIEDIWKAIDLLHSKGCRTVVISSAELPSQSTLNVFASSKKDGANERVTMNFEKLPMNFGGTGDLFSALFLSWMHKTGNNLKESLEKTVSTLQAVLKRTLESMKGNERNIKYVELRLIQSKCDIEEPKIIYSASVVE